MRVDISKSDFVKSTGISKPAATEYLQSEKREYLTGIGPEKHFDSYFSV
jgi:hypothetical protein